MTDQLPAVDGFVRVANRSELREGKGKRVVIEGEEIALWVVAGQVHAISNVCAHQHFARLHEGYLDNGLVVCPMHGWAYSLETGRAIKGEGRVPVYPVKSVGDQVYVALKPIP